MCVVESEEVRFWCGWGEGWIDFELSTVLKERHSNSVVFGQSKPPVHLV